MPPLVPFWVNCFVAPQPTAQRCFAVGRHIARVVAESPWNVAVIATGGLSHFPELSLARVGQSDVAFDRRVVKWMEAGNYEPVTALTAKELHESGSHELLNWLVLLGAVLTVVALFYYLIVAKRMYIEAPDASAGRIPLPGSLALAVILCALVVVGLGLYPKPIVMAALRVAAPLF